MSASPNTQAILLLTAHFSTPHKGAAKPLTPTEWGRFALWLNEKKMTPEKLMDGQLEDRLNSWSDKTITLDRITGLLERGSALALAMEKWLRAGLWVITRSDPDYPKHLKQRLGKNSPALLFGCGSKSLLNRGGLAVVGSRNTTKQDLAYSRELGRMTASNGYSIISGGARGVDETSMLGALETGGTVTGVLADSLLQACSSKKYRKYLMDKNLVLISPFYPEAGFNIGNAMARNKYIYCLSDAALVVHSGKKGGTWSGAEENLKKQWVRLWIKRTNDKNSGNADIVKKGAEWISEIIRDVDFKDLFATRPIEENLFLPKAGNSKISGAESSEKKRKAKAEPPVVADEKSPSSPPNVSVKPVETSENKRQGEKTSLPIEEIAFYDLFLVKIQALCAKSPKKPDDLVDALQLNKSQLNTWLKQAVADKKLEKLTNPVRYQWLAEQKGLFAEIEKCA